MLAGWMIRVFQGAGCFDLRLGNETETIDVVDGIVLKGHVSSPEVDCR